MSERSFPPLDVTPMWTSVNEDLIALVDLVPDDKLDWSPREELWNFRGILLHVAMSRLGWLLGILPESGGSAGANPRAEAARSVLQQGQTKQGIKEQLRLSWERVQRFVSDPALLSAEHHGEFVDGEAWRHDGHWIAFHLLEHDVHHRADIFHYLSELGIEHPEVGVP